jgi:hypothetical protein
MTTAKLFALLPLLLIGVCGCASDPLTAAVNGIVARDVIKSAEGAADRTLIKAQHAGDAIEGKLAADLKSLSQNAILLLSDKLDDKLSQLNTDENNLLQQLRQLTDAANGIKPLATEWRSDAAIDINNAVGRLPFTKGLDFLVERVDGHVHYRGKGDIALTFTGIGLADQSSLRHAHISRLRLGDQEIPAFAQQRIDDSHLTLIMPEAVLGATSLAPDKFGFVTLTLWSEVTTSGGFMSRQKTRRYQFDTVLTIVPETVGTGTLTYDVPKMDWVVDSEEVRDATFQTHNHTDRPDKWLLEKHGWNAPAGTRFVLGSFHWTNQFEGQPNYFPFTTLLEHDFPPGNPRRGYVDCAEGHKVATLVFESWGLSIPVTLLAKVERLTATGVTKTAIPLEVKTSAPIRAAVPKEATTWIFECKTITGRTFSVRQGEVISGLSVNEQLSGNSRNITITINSLP